MGIIYKIISPSGKLYIGQTIKSMDQRWKEHIEDATNPKKDHCKALNAAIRKYNIGDFRIELIIECCNSTLDKYEETYINEFQSTVPNGYNIKLGGSSGMHSDETKLKISNSLKGRIVSQCTRTKIMISKKSNLELPMYIIEVVKNSTITGYRVCNHPMGPEKRFLSNFQSLEMKLQRAKKYLSELNDRVEQLHTSSQKLPKYLQKHKKGYCVKFPNVKSKYFYSTNITDEEKLSQALSYLNLLSMEKVQRLNDSG
jgi:hypothetical protein